MAIAVVTGGGSGIGRACCRLLARKGWRVMVLDINEGNAQAVAAEIGGTAYGVDVSDEVAVETLAKRIEAEVGPIEGLVNCAGLLPAPVAPDDLPMTEWDRITRVNQRGTYLCCVIFGRQMAARRRGTIVNMASITALRSMPLHAYGPTKAAVVAITMNLAAEWGPLGVRVNAVSPGFTRSPPFQAKIDSGERDTRALEANTALRRIMEPEDIANAVAFLMSDDASAITGVNLPVDGGWLCMQSWMSYPGVRGDWP